MTYFHLAFFMGLLGSMHCAVMCGPLLIAVQGGASVTWRNTCNKLLYQSGRIFTYGLLGLFFGLFGVLASMQGWQQRFSLITGVFLLVLGGLQIFAKRSSWISKVQSRAVQPFVRIMSRWLFSPGGTFLSGMVNGLLPCGMVYMALASAVNAASITDSFLFMLVFGLGTLPLLLLISFIGNSNTLFLKNNFANLLPILYLIMGCWFILRGANLDIPYLSPLLNVDGALNCA